MAATIACAGGMFIDAALANVIIPVMPAVAKTYGLSGRQSGVVIGSFAIAALASTPLAAALAMRVPPRRLMVCGLIVIASGAALLALGLGFWPLVAARALAGSGGTILWAAAFAARALRHPERQGHAVGLLVSASALGGVAGSAMAALYDRLGGLAVVWGLCACALLVLAPAVVMTELHAPSERLRIGEVMRMLREPLPATGILALVLMGGVTGWLSVVVPAHLHRSGYHTSEIGAAYVGVAVIVALAAWVAGRLSDAWTPSGALVLIYAAAPSALLMAAAAGRGVVLAPAAVVAIASVYVATVPAMALVAPPPGAAVTALATRFAAINCAWQPAVGAGAVAVGVVGANAGWSATVPVSAAPLALLAAASANRLSTKPRRSWR